MSVTRKVHVVRCTDAPPDDPTNYSRFVDVLVLDAIAMLGPNGEEFVFDCAAKNAVPAIIDNTGDGESSTPGSPTRLSHMERLTNADDNTQFLDVEILDAFALRGPNGVETVFDMRKPGATNIVDKTDLNLGQTVGDASRRAHVLKIEPSDKPTTQELMQGETPANPTLGTYGDYLAVLVLDAIAFSGPIGASDTESGDPIGELRANREMLLLAGNSDFSDFASWNDATQYDADGNPPVNDDPHIYVRFPQASGAASGSPWLGSHPTSDQDPDRSGPLCQGLLWHIINASGHNFLTISVIVTNDERPLPPPGAWSPGTTVSPVFYVGGFLGNFVPAAGDPPKLNFGGSAGGMGTLSIPSDWYKQTGGDDKAAQPADPYVGLPGAIGSNFGGPTSDAATFGDYYIVNLKGLQTAAGAKGSVTFQIQLGYGPADANHFAFTAQIATWSGGSSWEQDPSAPPIGYLVGVGGASSGDAPEYQNPARGAKAVDTKIATNPGGGGGGGFGSIVNVSVDLRTLKLTVSSTFET